MGIKYDIAKVQNQEGCSRSWSHKQEAQSSGVDYGHKERCVHPVEGQVCVVNQLALRTAEVHEIIQIRTEIRAKTHHPAPSRRHVFDHSISLCPKIPDDI